MPSGYPWSKSVRREFFDLVCRGSTLGQAAVKVGVSYNAGWKWWRDAGAMKLRMGRGVGGLVSAGDWSRPGGRGHRICFAERVEIMRGLDANHTYAQIGERIGRDASVVWREVQRNKTADGDYHALMAHAYATENARRPKAFTLHNPGSVGRLNTGWIRVGVPG